MELHVPPKDSKYLGRSTLIQGFPPQKMDPNLRKSHPCLDIPDATFPRYVMSPPSQHYYMTENLQMYSQILRPHIVVHRYNILAHLRSSSCNPW